MSVAIAGWILSYTMLAFRNIVAVVGLHVGWNFIQSTLTSKLLWHYSKHDDAMLSGGAHGLEASIIGIVVTSMAAAVCLLLYFQRHRKRSEYSHPKRLK